MKRLDGHVAGEIEGDGAEVRGGAVGEVVGSVGGGFEHGGVVAVVVGLVVFLRLEHGWSLCIYGGVITRWRVCGVHDVSRGRHSWV